MGILPMSLTGVPPVQMPKNMGKMPMRLMGETPMLRRMAFFNGLLRLAKGLKNGDRRRFRPPRRKIDLSSRFPVKEAPYGATTSGGRISTL